MNVKESSSENTENREGDKKNKKILISEQDYQYKFCSCVGACFPLAFLAFIGSLAGLPFALKLVRFAPLTLEVRALTGLLSGLPLGYAVAKWHRESCEQRVEQTYYYRIKKK